MGGSASEGVPVEHGAEREAQRDSARADYHGVTNVASAVPTEEEGEVQEI